MRAERSAAVGFFDDDLRMGFPLRFASAFAACMPDFVYENILFPTLGMVQVSARSHGK
jgi:hypothetical protein